MKTLCRERGREWIRDINQPKLNDPEYRWNMVPSLYSGYRKAGKWWQKNIGMEFLYPQSLIESQHGELQVMDRIQSVRGHTKQRTNIFFP